MKKTAMLLAFVVFAFGLAQCSMFTTKVTYIVTGNDTEPMQIMYQSGSDLTEVTANNYWITEYNILNDDKPELLFIRVTKNAGLAFNVEIRTDDVTRSSGTSGVPPATVELYWVAE
jgi:hypothetical protein